MNRAEILSTAESLINGDRDKDYGDAAENFDRIAKLWEPIFGVAVTATQVALAMNQVKVARLCAAPGHGDSWVDGAGYLALGGEIATESVDDEPLDDSIQGFFGLRTDAGWISPGARRREPRVVNELTEDCRDAEWLLDATGSRYRWNGTDWEFRRDGYPKWNVATLPYTAFSTFTEIID